MTDTRSPIRLTDRGYVAVAALLTIVAVILFRPMVWTAVTLSDLVVLSAPVTVPVLVGSALFLILVRVDTRR